MPYAAVIKDSFREALASRVLWVLTGFILVVLLLLAPLGYRLNLTGEFSWGDISDGPQLARRLSEGSGSPAASPARRIWSLLDEETQARVGKLIDGSESEQGRDFVRGMEALRRGFNKLLVKPDLYTAKDWEGVTLPQDAEELLRRPRESLDKEELARLNRLLIESVAPGSFAPRSAYSIVITYFWLASDPLPFSKSQVESFIKQWILPTVMGWIVGVFGMIAAILVTSTIIPQMFEPGSITLLLSKPISRWLLLVAKFLGGCAFVLINVTLLIVGLWLIAGWRFGIWNHGMLWCIPVFLFMFLIYYAVSALTGLVWKSAIVSVIVTVVFWIACFVVDLTHEVIEAAILQQQRINRIVVADGHVLALNEATRLSLWDEEAGLWRPVGEPKGGAGIPVIVGPYYHQPSGQLLIGQGFRNPFGGRQQRISLRLADAAGGWSPTEGPSMPSGTSSIVVAADNTIYAIASDNIFRFQGELTEKAAAINMFGLRVPLGGGGKFVPALEGERPALPDPIAAAADPKEPRLIVAAASDVYLLRQVEGGDLKQVARQAFDEQEVQGSAVAIAGKLAVVAREDGNVWLLSADDLKVEKSLLLEPDSQPRFAVASADGSQIGVLFQNRRLWLIDAESGEAALAPVAAQGEISGLAWSGKRLLVGDYANRIVAYDAKSLQRERTYRPPLSLPEIVYYYAVQPLYTIFPKPRMLNNTVQYLITGKRTTDMGFFRGNLAQQREDLEPWKPVWSGLAFVAIVMLAACVYIEWQEF